MTGAGREGDEPADIIGDAIGDARSLASALDRVVGGLGDRAVILGVHNHWIDAVGSAIADHCTPRRVADGRLVVEVDHPGWASEVRYLEQQIVERLCDSLGAGVVDSLTVTVAGPRGQSS